MLKRLLIILLPAIMFGCGPQIIRTGSGVNHDFTATVPQSIEIYRSLKPNWKYVEIGVITLQSNSYLPAIYESFRREAGKKGADAIIDFDFDSESRIVAEQETQTDSQGNTYTVWNDVRYVYYTASGTLVRRVQEVK